jgi:Septum formation
MAAPAGVSSGSASEPAVPVPAATEPTALGSAAPEPSGPAPGENAAANAVPEPSAPAPGENAAAIAVPEPSEPAPGENAAAIAVPEPSGPAPGENAAAIAVPEPSGPAPGENAAAIAVPEPSEPAYGENAAAGGDPEPEPLADEPTREGRRVSWLVTAGVIVVLIAVAAAAGALAVATHGFRPKTIVTVTYKPAAVFGLRAGECINSSPNGLSVTVLSCRTPHQAEVFATFSLTGSSWPGSAAVQQQASSGCANRLAGYLNPQLLNAGLTQEYVYPNRDAWQAGVRTVVCEVSSATGLLSGSVRNRG